MSPQIAVQLYTLRKRMEHHFDEVLEAVAAMGYAGVEAAGMYGGSPAAFAQRCKELGLQICSAHLKLPGNGPNDAIIETALALGVQRIVCPWLPPASFASVDAIRRNAELLNEAAAAAKAHGLTLGYHNHDAEFRIVEGKPAVEWLEETLDPAVFFEPDVYWIAVAGGDPVATLQRLGARAPLVHIKDGPAGEKPSPMTAVGAGTLPIPAIVAAAEQADWLIVELDEAKTDPLDAVRESYAFLKGL
jgi:sugar phosphate isomerase/epimerase